ncbi:MAG: hypothetical protein ACYSSN_04025 [Planctomycetota bacterium]|jgi:rubrerythrin
MKTEFNVDQVFQIAGRIQQNGAEFYLKMAKRFCDSRRRGLCLVLAEQRTERAKALTEERKRFCNKYGKSVTSGYGDYIMSHPSEMADLAVFSHEQYHAIPLTGRDGREEILKDAIGRSEAVIVFFQGLKEFAQDAVTERALDKIIEEENHHINLLRSRANVWTASSE